MGVCSYPAMKAAGIQRGDRTPGFHILQDTAASLLHELTGGNLKSVQEFLRQSKIGTTADVYVHQENTAANGSSELFAQRRSMTLAPAWTPPTRFPPEPNITPEKLSVPTLQDLTVSAARFTGLQCGR